MVKRAIITPFDCNSTANKRQCPYWFQSSISLTSLMRDCGTTQVQLEKAGVVAQSTLSQILAGKRGISKATAKKLGAFFGVSSVVFL
jgi:antitoxin component HigA of HigAB toxin-antitoxin module